MVSKTTFKIKLRDLIDSSELSKLSPSAKNDIKTEIGEYVIDRILSDTSSQRSAVTGQRWKGLSKEYKKIKSKTAPGVANLELHGDMLDALKSKNNMQGVEIGIFDSDQAQKSDNHNKFSGAAKRTKLPARRFLPDKDRKLRSGIMKEVIQIAKEAARGEKG